MSYSTPVHQIWPADEREEFFREHGEARVRAKEIRSFVSVFPLFTYTDPLVELRAHGDPQKKERLIKLRDSQVARLAEQNVHLLVPTEVLAGYASGSYVLHTLGTPVPATEVRNHLQHIASQVAQGAFGLRFYPQRETLYFTVYNRSQVYVALGSQPGNRLWGISSKDHGLIRLFFRAI